MISIVSNTCLVVAVVLWFVAAAAVVDVLILRVQLDSRFPKNLLEIPNTTRNKKVVLGWCPKNPFVEEQGKAFSMVCSIVL